jgi:ATP-dependent exoDNAse (exonuclease V) beta subunit
MHVEKTSATLLGHCVQFDPIEHKYYVDGTWVPSVSQICKLENPEMYRDIDQATLSRAAAKGVGLHEEIEQYELHGVIGTSMEFDNYLRIKKRLGFKKDMSETMIIIKHENQVVCAGRFDLLAMIEQAHVLIDFKRTSEIHRKYVKLQLNLYRLGLKQCYQKDIKRLMMIRLRGYEANIIEFDVDEDNTYHVLSKYKHIEG